MKYHSIVLVSIIGLISIATVYSSNNCCAKNAYVKTSRNCTDGSGTLIPKCDGYRVMLNNEWSYFSHYLIRNDTNGVYLDDFVGGFIVRPPNFCVGQMKYSYSSKISTVAIICSTLRTYYHQLNTKLNETDNPDYYLTYWDTYDGFVELSSCLLLAVAFYVYYLVIPTRQIEDDCLLNLAGCLSLSYAAFFYAYINSLGILPDTCITNIYVVYYFLLSGFAWYAIYTYYLWKKFKCGWLEENDVILNKFKIIGYGVPALLIILVNIHAHFNKLYTEFSFEMDCDIHSLLMEEIYVYAPIIATVGTNCYFWRDLKNYIEIKTVKTTEDDLNKKKINSLLMLNQRLFLIFALPWLLYAIMSGLFEVFETDFLEKVMWVTDSAIKTFGIIIALILVMSRARVWKCIILKYKDFQWLQKWQPSDEDGGPLYDNDNLTVSQTFPSEV